MPARPDPGIATVMLFLRSTQMALPRLALVMHIPPQRPALGIPGIPKHRLIVRARPMRSRPNVGLIGRRHPMRGPAMDIRSNR